MEGFGVLAELGANLPAFVEWVRELADSPLSAVPDLLGFAIQARELAACLKRDTTPFEYASVDQQKASALSGILLNMVKLYTMTVDCLITGAIKPQDGQALLDRFMDLRATYLGQKRFLGLSKVLEDEDFQKPMRLLRDLLLTALADPQQTPVKDLATFFGMDPKLPREFAQVFLGLGKGRPFEGGGYLNIMYQVADRKWTRLGAGCFASPPVPVTSLWQALPFWGITPTPGPRAETTPLRKIQLANIKGGGTSEDLYGLVKFPLTLVKRLGAHQLWRASHKIHLLGECVARDPVDSGSAAMALHGVFPIYYVVRVNLLQEPGVIRGGFHHQAPRNTSSSPSEFNYHLVVPQFPSPCGCTLWSEWNRWARWTRGTFRSGQDDSCVYRSGPIDDDLICHWFSRLLVLYDVATSLSELYVSPTGQYVDGFGLLCDNNVVTVGQELVVGALPPRLESPCGRRLVVQRGYLTSLFLDHQPDRGRVKFASKYRFHYGSDRLAYFQADEMLSSMYKEGGKGFPCRCPPGSPEAAALSLTSDPEFKGSADFYKDQIKWRDWLGVCGLALESSPKLRAVHNDLFGVAILFYISVVGKWPYRKQGKLKTKSHRLIGIGGRQEVFSSATWNPIKKLKGLLRSPSLENPNKYLKEYKKLRGEQARLKELQMLEGRQPLPSKQREEKENLVKLISSAQQVLHKVDNQTKVLRSLISTKLLEQVERMMFLGNPPKVEDLLDSAECKTTLTQFVSELKLVLGKLWVCLSGPAPHLDLVKVAEAPTIKALWATGGSEVGERSATFDQLLKLETRGGVVRRSGTPHEFYIPFRLKPPGSKSEFSWETIVDDLPEPLSSQPVPPTPSTKDPPFFSGFFGALLKETLLQVQLPSDLYSVQVAALHLRRRECGFVSAGGDDLSLAGIVCQQAGVVQVQREVQGVGLGGMLREAGRSSWQEYEESLQLAPLDVPGPSLLKLEGSGPVGPCVSELETETLDVYGIPSQCERDLVRVWPLLSRELWDCDMVTFFGGSSRIYGSRGSRPNYVWPCYVFNALPSSPSPGTTGWAWSGVKVGIVDVTSGVYLSDLQSRLGLGKMKELKTVLFEDVCVPLAAPINSSEDKCPIWTWLTDLSGGALEQLIIRNCYLRDFRDLDPSGSASQTSPPSGRALQRTAALLSDLLSPRRRTGTPLPPETSAPGPDNTVYCGDVYTGGFSARLVAWIGQLSSLEHLKKLVIDQPTWRAGLKWLGELAENHRPLLGRLEELELNLQLQPFSRETGVGDADDEQSGEPSCLRLGGYNMSVYRVFRRFFGSLSGIKRLKVTIPPGSSGVSPELERGLGASVVAGDLGTLEDLWLGGDLWDVYGGTVASSWASEARSQSLRWVVTQFASLSNAASLTLCPRHSVCAGPSYQYVRPGSRGRGWGEKLEADGCNLKKLRLSGSWSVFGVLSVLRQFRDTLSLEGLDLGGVHLEDEEAVSFLLPGLTRAGLYLFRPSSSGPLRPCKCFMLPCDTRAWFWDPSSATQLVRFLETHHLTLEAVSLAGLSAFRVAEPGLMERSVGKHLGTCVKVETLLLSWDTDAPAPTVPGHVLPLLVREIASQVCQSRGPDRVFRSLRILSLCGSSRQVLELPCGWSETLVDVLCQVCESVERLVLQDLQLGDEFLLQVFGGASGKWPKLRQLVLRGNRFTFFGLDSVGAWLGGRRETCPVVEELDLARNPTLRTLVQSRVSSGDGGGTDLDTTSSLAHGQLLARDRFYRRVVGRVSRLGLDGCQLLAQDFVRLLDTQLAQSLSVAHHATALISSPSTTVSSDAAAYYLCTGRVPLRRLGFSCNPLGGGRILGPSEPAPVILDQQLSHGLWEYMDVLQRWEEQCAQVDGPQREPWDVKRDLVVILGRWIGELDLSRTGLSLVSTADPDFGRKDDYLWVCRWLTPSSETGLYPFVRSLRLAANNLVPLVALLNVGQLVKHLDVRGSFVSYELKGSLSSWKNIRTLLQQLRTLLVIEPLQLARKTRARRSGTSPQTLTNVSDLELLRNLVCLPSLEELCVFLRAKFEVSTSSSPPHWPVAPFGRVGQGVFQGTSRASLALPDGAGPQRRWACQEFGPIVPGDTDPTRYLVGDHRGSGNALLQVTGTLSTALLYSGSLNQPDLVQYSFDGPSHVVLFMSSYTNNHGQLKWMRRVLDNTKPLPTLSASGTAYSTLVVYSDLPVIRGLTLHPCYRDETQGQSRCRGVLVPRSLSSLGSVEDEARPGVEAWNPGGGSWVGVVVSRGSSSPSSHPTGTDPRAPAKYAVGATPFSEILPRVRGSYEVPMDFGDDVVPDTELFFQTLAQQVSGQSTLSLRDAWQIDDCD